MPATRSRARPTEAEVLETITDLMAERFPVTRPSGRTTVTLPGPTLLDLARVYDLYPEQLRDVLGELLATGAVRLVFVGCYRSYVPTPVEAA